MAYTYERPDLRALAELEELFQNLGAEVAAWRRRSLKAEAELQEPIYDPELLATDYVFVLKKLGLSEAEFEAIMRTPPRPHTDFPVERSTYAAFPILRPLRPLAGALRRTLRRGARADA